MKTAALELDDSELELEESPDEEELWVIPTANKTRTGEICIAEGGQLRRFIVRRQLVHRFA